LAEKAKYPALPIAGTVEIGSETVKTAALPRGVRVMEHIGIAGVQALEGSLLYRAPTILYEVRATVTPGGDYLVMFPVGGHYNQTDQKINTMVALRSSDKGKTWSAPYLPFRIEYNQHGFIPLIPKGSKRIYSFGTQAVFGLFRRDQGLFENAPIGWLYSDDDGYTWNGPELINPVNDPGFTGMSVMRMCETNKGTWLLGSHEGYHDFKPVISNQYILRSEDRGKTWEALPDKRTGGWHVKSLHRMDEGRPIQVGDRILLLARTPEGHLWALWSDDDGKTWTEPASTPLIHPDAPPMVTHLSDGNTLVCLHHNRFHDHDYTGLDPSKVSIMGDRSEIWAAISTDCGKTWSEPGFLYCNAVRHEEGKPPFINYMCSYNDIWVDDGVLNIFVPHRWQQALHLQIREEELYRLPKRSDLLK